MKPIDSALIKAYTSLNSELRCTTEDITCDPEFRGPFLQRLRSGDPQIPEAEALLVSPIFARDPGFRPFHGSRESEA